MTVTMTITEATKDLGITDINDNARAGRAGDSGQAGERAVVRKASHILFTINSDKSPIPFSIYTLKDDDDDDDDDAR